MPNCPDSCMTSECRGTRLLDIKTGRPNGTMRWECQVCNRTWYTSDVPKRRSLLGRLWAWVMEPLS